MTPLIRLFAVVALSFGSLATLHAAGKPGALSVFAGNYSGTATYTYGMTFAGTSKLKITAVKTGLSGQIAATGTVVQMGTPFSISNNFTLLKGGVLKVSDVSPPSGGAASGTYKVHATKTGGTITGGGKADTLTYKVDVKLAVAKKTKTITITYTVGSGALPTVIVYKGTAKL